VLHGFIVALEQWAVQVARIPVHQYATQVK